ncbi:hypothetical protein VaNZ11_008622, partial [Volvox africanus]
YLYMLEYLIRQRPDLQDQSILTSVAGFAAHGSGSSRLKGFPEAINSIYPNTIVQVCIVHMVRNSVKYVSYKDLKAVTSDLKRIYTANSEEIGYLELKSFAAKLDNKYTVISDIWQRNWSGIILLFTFPDEISIQTWGA